MTEQNTEQGKERRLTTALSKVEELERKSTYNSIINDKKERLTQLSRSSIMDIAIYTKYTKDIENELFSLMTDELTDDLYDSVEWEKVKNFIRFSNNKFIKQEVVIQDLFNFIVDFIDILNESGKMPTKPKSIIGDEEPTLSAEERDRLQSIAYQDILSYQKAANTRKGFWMREIRKKADTLEKINIVDNLFFEVTGERKLSKSIEEEEKEKNKEEGQSDA